MYSCGSDVSTNIDVKASAESHNYRPAANQNRYATACIREKQSCSQHSCNTACKEKKQTVQSNQLAIACNRKAKFLALQVRGELS